MSELFTVTNLIYLGLAAAAYYWYNSKNPSPPAPSPVSPPNVPLPDLLPANLRLLLDFLKTLQSKKDAVEAKVMIEDLLKHHEPVKS